MGVERQRFQSAANLQRMLVITAFLAVRVLQLREVLDTSGNNAQASCETILSEDEWKVVGVDPAQRAPNDRALEALGVPGGCKAGRIYGHQTHRASGMGHDVARLVSLAGAT